MKRSARLTDFLLVTVAVTTILLSLWPLSAKQQSPEQTDPSESMVQSAIGETELAVIDPETAVANWQSEVASFYAQSDTVAKSELAQLPAESPVQTVSYNETVATRSSKSSNSRPASVIARQGPKAHFGLMLQDHHAPMTFFFAICGGALLGLGYLEWSRQAPKVSPAALEFHDANDEVTSVAFDDNWGSVHQSKAVAARRATLAGVVVWALASLVL